MRTRPLLASIAAAGIVVAIVATAAAPAATVDSAPRAALAPLAAGRQPPPSLFGINTGTYDDNEARLARDLPTAVALGARWVHFTGDSIKYSNGRPSFVLMDREVDSARRLGLGVVISLGGIRAACSLDPPPGDPTDCPPTTPRDLSLYAAYLRTLLHHFAGRVSYYESWVEPNHRSFWPSGPNPAQYAALLETEYRVFRASAPADKLMFASPADFGIEPGSPGGIAVLPFTDAVLGDLHGQRAFDLVALHGYRYPPTLSPDDEGWTLYPQSPIWRRDTWTAQLEAYEQEFTSHGYGHPALWLTEFGWPGNATAAGDYYPDLAAQATDVAQAYQALESAPLSSFVQAAFWFNQRDYTPGVANPDPAFFAHYGLLDYDFAPKPAAAVFERYAKGGA